MAFGSFGSGGDAPQPQPMAEINTTPLVDVMLVLLIIFIVTAPLLTHGIRIDLPKASSSASPEKPETVTLSLDAQGKVFWNDAPLTEAELPAALARAAGQGMEGLLHRIAGARLARQGGKTHQFIEGGRQPGL